MPYIEKEAGDQMTFLPDYIEDYVDKDNPVRVIDAFVDSIDLLSMGFTHTILADTGRPPYDPKDLLKLYIYGYLNKIRSSRKLLLESRRNIELFWLMGKLQPDFRTISDFRKDNAKVLKEVFKNFIRLCDKLNLYNKEVISVDGSKFRAQNSDDRCFNADILNR